MIRQMMKKTLLFLCVFMLGATGALAAYPDHPITLVVPFGAGGGTDIPARLLAGMMEKRLGQPIVVQNVSGAGGTLGPGFAFSYIAGMNATALSPWE